MTATATDYQRLAEPECATTRREHYDRELHHCNDMVLHAVEAHGVNSIQAHRAATVYDRIKALRDRVLAEESAA